MSWYEENLSGFEPEPIEYEPERKQIICMQCGGEEEDCPLCKGNELKIPYGTKGSK